LTNAFSKKLENLQAAERAQWQRSYVQATDWASEQDWRL